MSVHAEIRTLGGPTLAEFMADGSLSNSYVYEPEFYVLYLRKGMRYIKTARGEQYERCDVLDIANIKAMLPGQGSFTKLVARLQREYPTWPIYVENAMKERFQKKLVAMGFELVGITQQEGPRSYILWPKEKT